MTALRGLATDGRDWSEVGIDDLIERLEVTFADFTGLMGNLRQVV
jgi:hypothetical protein